MFLSLKFLVCAVGVLFLKLLIPAQAQLDINRIGILQVVGEKQYFVEKSVRVVFHRALQICASLNMTLASIESGTEQQNLKNLLYTNSILSLKYWLSGNDLPLNGEFVWFGSGSLFSYTSWATGVRSTPSQRCVRTDVNFNWRREYCNSANYFICEKPVLPVCGLNGECNTKPLIIY